MLVKKRASFFILNHRIEDIVLQKGIIHLFALFSPCIILTNVYSFLKKSSVYN